MTSLRLRAAAPLVLASLTLHTVAAHAQTDPPAAVDDERPGAPRAVTPATPPQPAQTTEAPPSAETPAPAPEAPLVPAPAAPAAPSAPPPITLGGWAETYFAYNFNTPWNAINAYRIYDLRHDHFAFNNLAFELGWQTRGVQGHVVLQLGALAAEAYESATTLARAQEELLWRVVQEATFGWSPSIRGRRPLTLEAGLFVAPFGVEYVQIYKNWNWSPSNLFYIAPFQMTGVRAGWQLTDEIRLRAGLYSGWERIVDDNNDYQTLLVQAEYTKGDDLALSVQYMAGVERDRTAREGPWVRHTFDHYGEARVNTWLQLRWHVFAGLEPNRLGTAGWFGAAAYARVQMLDWLFAAARIDGFHEWVPDRGASLFALGTARTVGSGTVTLEARPEDHFSVRLEYRHDLADAPLYYDATRRVERATGAELPTADGQNTVLVGATAWF